MSATVTTVAQEPELLTIQEVALFCRVADKTVLSWLKQKRMAYLLVGPTHHTRIRRSEFERFIHEVGIANETKTAGPSSVNR